jgi:hypothetical protein
MAVPAGTWCDNCNRLIEDAQERSDADGTASCPHCAAPLSEAEVPEEDAPPRPPWHFKVLLVGTVGYLIYRVIWFIFWIKQHA